MTVTIEDIEALRRVLAELPRHQPKEVSKQEAIALLASELGTARRRGYKPEELARILSERGVAINAATLRGYLRRNRKSRSTPDGKSVREAGGSPTPPAHADAGLSTRPPGPTVTTSALPPRTRETPDATAPSRTQAAPPATGGPGAKVATLSLDGRDPQSPRR